MVYSCGKSQICIRAVALWQHTFKEELVKLLALCIYVIDGIILSYTKSNYLSLSKTEK